MKNEDDDERVDVCAACAHKQKKQERLKEKEQNNNKDMERGSGRMEEVCVPACFRRCRDYP